MNASDYVAGFLTTNTQKAYAAKCARAADDEGETPEAPKKEGDGPTKPAGLTKETLVRVRKLLGGPNVKNLDDALHRLDVLIEALSDDDQGDKKNDSEDGPSSNAKTR